MTDAELLKPIFDRNGIPQTLRGDLLTYLTVNRPITARLRKRFLEARFQRCVGECLAALTSDFVRRIVGA